MKFFYILTMLVKNKKTIYRIKKKKNYKNKN